MQPLHAAMLCAVAGGMGIVKKIPKQAVVNAARRASAQRAREASAPAGAPPKKKQASAPAGTPAP